MPVIEAEDLIFALDADVQDASVPCHRFGVPSAGAFAVGAQSRRHFGIADRCGMVFLVDDAAAQPIALVGKREKVRSIRLNIQRGKAAEGRVRGFENQPAPEIKIAETAARGIVEIESVDPFGADADGMRHNGIIRNQTACRQNQQNR